MRPYEICLLLVNLPLLAWGIFLRRPKPEWPLLFSFFAPLLLLAHLGVENGRWQMIPAYLVIAISFVTSFRLLTRPITSRPTRSLRTMLPDSIALALIGCSALLSLIFPVFEFPTPTGLYSVGTVTLHLVDNSRFETFSKNPKDHRELMVQLWYPATPLPGMPEHYLYNLDGAKAAKQQAYGFRFAQLDLVQTHSFPKARLSLQQPNYPILIFSPSWAGSRNQNTFQAEELASHGFVVAGIDHTYCTGITVLPDGRVILSGHELDADFSSDEAVQRYIRIAGEQARLRALDASFVLNQLEELNAHDPAGRFTHRLDLNRVGIFGHSFGGTVAAEACLLDKRFRAGLNMDGMLFGDIVEKPVTQPFMFMNSDDVPPTAEEMAKSSFAKLDDRGFRVQDAYLKRNGGYNLLIKQAKHLNFSDTALFSPIRRFTGAGTVNARRCLRIVNDYTLAFFGKHLNNTPSALLNGSSPDYPEVKLEKYGK
jgi:dienelactone hydrolase